METNADLMGIACVLPLLWDTDCQWLLQPATRTLNSLHFACPAPVLQAHLQKQQGKAINSDLARSPTSEDSPHRSQLHGITLSCV